MARTALQLQRRCTVGRGHNTVKRGVERFTYADSRNEGVAAIISVKYVAERAGVSIGTVSNVLNHPHKVAADTAERVQQAIAELGFVRNDAARQLRAGS